MRVAQAMMLFALGGVVRAQDPFEVRVCTVRYVDDPKLQINVAQGVASRILAGAGVRVKWQLGEPRRSDRAAVLVIVSSNTSRTFLPGALAYAQLFDGVHIKVFWDRITDRVHDESLLSAFLLGHVMAHELTHILEGIPRHSEAGLMKARWTGPEIEHMAVEPLWLDKEDIDLIHKGRTQRQASTESARIPLMLTRDARYHESKFAE
jgi:hypothetical protein